MKKDEETKKHVLDQLIWDSRIDASKVQVQVSDGTGHPGR